MRRLCKEKTTKLLLQAAAATGKVMLITVLCGGEANGVGENVVCNDPGRGRSLQWLPNRDEMWAAEKYIVISLIFA